jgi:UDP-glucose:(heptosyl)LPS alpha-1,3-glucosyltransferase
LQGKHRELLELESAVFSPDAKRLIIANSKMVAGEIAHYFQTPRDRVQVIYNGLPLSSFNQPPPTAPRAPGKCVVLFVGTGWERKGLRFAMEGVNRTAEANLMVAGAGKRRGLPASARTQFLGEVKGIRELMAAADVFVLPTIYDPFSNATLEAMAAGLPVITTDANGFAEVMRPDADGEILRDPADVDGIAAGIEKWSARETLESREARQMEARRFTMEENVRQTLAALEKTNP